MINREDMLELTRRMTPARHCFDRIAGAYMDGDGIVDGSFNIHFGKLEPSEAARYLCRLFGFFCSGKNFLIISKNPPASWVACDAAS